MLTISLVKNAGSSGGAAKYYLKEDNYYMSEVDAKETSFWWGSGALELGLKGKVEERKLQKTLEGSLPNGVTIGLQKDGTINHRAGYDLCFHAPKSVSILALDGEDGRFYNAHLDAVKETLKIIERDCAQSKVFKNKQIRFENTKNLTVALVKHTTSRELDLHLHTHALVMNATKRHDNRWRALASSTLKSNEGVNGFFERIHKNQIYYGLIYKSSLANKIQSLGCEIETVGLHGLWEIKGVPKEARDMMSKRRKIIEEQINKLSYRSLKAADVAALDTRKKKPKDIKSDELKKIWQDELASVGFSSKEFIASLAELDKNKNALALVGKEGLETNDSKIIENIKEMKEIKEFKKAKEAVKDAIEHLSQYSLKLDYAKIIAKSLEFTIGKNTHGDIVLALNEAIKEGQLIPLDQPDSMFITKELIETEKAIMDMVGRGKETGEAKESKDTKEIKGTSKVSTAITIKPKALESIIGKELKNSVVEVLQSNNRLSLIESRMIDNTEFVSMVLNLAETSAKTVRILSPNRIMANDINESIRRKPSNLWQWLVSLGKPELGESIAGFMHKYKEEVNLPLLQFRQNRDVIVVNNAETLGCRDMRSLLELTEKTNAKVIFLRDLNSKHGFGAGNAIETLKQSGVETFKINAIKKMVTQVPELKAIRDDKERTRQLGLLYASKNDMERNDTTVLVGSKKQLKSTNEAVREELKASGKLSGIEYSISILDPVYMSKPEARLAHRYPKDMVVRFYYANSPYQDWEIEQIDRNQNTMKLFKDGKRIKRVLWGSKNWNPKKQETSRVLFRKEILQIARGDRLIATGNMKDFGIKNATKLVVQEIDNKYVRLLSGTKEIKINLDDLKDSHLQYDYAATISRYSKKQVGHIIADMKAYLLDKDTINELSSRAKESLVLFTNDENSAKKRFGHIPVKLTANEVILGAGKMATDVDRYVDEKTIEEIKSDIEKAILILDNHYKLLERADKKAVDFALEKITSRNAGFTHKELVTEALEYAIREQMAVQNKVVTRKDIEKVILEKRSSGELVMGKHFSDGTKWTTREILELEREIINDIKNGQQLEPFLDSKTAKSYLELKNEKLSLTQDQKNACYLITTTKDQFVVIQGYAGTGKTTMFSKVQDMLKKQAEYDQLEKTEEKNEKSEGNKKDIEILALAPTHRAVKELQSIGIEAQTLKSFLVELQKEKKEKKEQRGQNEQKESIVNGVVRDGKNKFNITSLDNKLIILDEASMVSNEDFRDFLKIVGDTKNHVVLSGDIAQHISISSGKPFEIIQRSSILKTAYLREIVRQKNLNLKEAVKDVIHGDYTSAFEKIINENPQKYIERVDTSLLNKRLNKRLAEESFDVAVQKEQEGQKKPEKQNKQKRQKRQNEIPEDFLNKLERSIVEIDNNVLKKGEKSLEQMVAEDYLSRTREIQDQTVIIVHANNDRRVITEIIRKGLKELGVIEKKGMMVDCLIAKGLTDAEHKSLQSYDVGDVVKFGKEYYHVMENDESSKSILLHGASKEVEKGRKEQNQQEKQEGQEKQKKRYFYPEKYAAKYKVEIYKHIKAELAIGDTVRLTKTDKKRSLYAGFEYMVKEVSSDGIVLESRDKEKLQGMQIVLNPKEFKDAHWDYAQTVTGYGIQGGSKSYVIDYEVSYREHLANQRSFYIGASRAINHLIIYTNDKVKLLRRILHNKGDKYAALEVTGDLPASNNNIEYDNRIAKKAEVTKGYVENKQSPDFYDIKKIKQLLSNSAESFIERLLGRPNERLSSTSEWRYGNKGSLAISLGGDKRGFWHNFETGESGDLLSLLQKETTLPFHEALKYVANMFGEGLYIDTLRKSDTKVLNSTTDKTHSKGSYKTGGYAQKLVTESLPIGGTIVEKYLKEIRSINNVDSSDIRYHPKVYTAKNEKQIYMPAMLALGRDKDGNIQCVQATYLDPKTAEKADIGIKKRTYASPSGALVSLKKYEGREKNISEDAGDNKSSENSKGNESNKSNKNNKNEISSITFITEGVETGLSIKDSIKIKNTGVAVTLGKSNFAAIDPHSIGQKVVFCLDNDGVQSVTDNAIHKAAQRLVDYGKKVFVAMPDQINGAKTDFNDVARKDGANAVRNYIINAISYKQFSKNLNLKKFKEINNKDDYTAFKSNNTGDGGGRSRDINVTAAQGLKQLDSFDINKKISLDLEI